MIVNKHVKTLSAESVLLTKENLEKAARWLLTNRAFVENNKSSLCMFLSSNAFLHEHIGNHAVLANGHLEILNTAKLKERWGEPDWQIVSEPNISSCDLCGVQALNREFYPCDQCDTNCCAQCITDRLCDDCFPGAE